MCCKVCMSKFFLVMRLKPAFKNCGLKLWISAHAKIALQSAEWNFLKIFEIRIKNENKSCKSRVLEVGLSLMIRKNLNMCTLQYIFSRRQFVPKLATKIAFCLAVRKFFLRSRRQHECEDFGIIFLANGQFFLKFSKIC